MTFMEDNFAGPANRRAQREDLAIRKKALDAELTSKGYDPKDLSIRPGGNADVEQEQNKLILQNQKAMQGKLAVQDSDKALEDFAHTGDASYLQNALNNNPVLKKAWGDKGVQAISNIDFSNDSKLLAQRGFNGAEYDTPEKQGILKKNIYKYYDGKEWNVGLLNNVVAETGTMNRLGERRGGVFETNHQEFRDFMAGPRSSPNTAEGHKYETEINRASEVTGVPPNLIASMIHQESKGDPNASSPRGARGLMQLMPETAKELGVMDINDPEQNILAGAQYLAKNLKKFNGDTRLALAAYNAGPSNVEKYNGIPPFAETQGYVSKVLNNYAAGESYYNAGAEVIKNANSMTQRPTVISDTNPADGIAREGKYADNRIATIQEFVQGNANAAKGSTNSLEERKVAAAEGAVEADKLAALAKIKEGGSTTTQKDLAAAESETQSLVTNFGGEDEFFKTDFNTNTPQGQANFNKAWKSIVKIGKLEGTSLTDQDKKDVTAVRGLIALGDPAAQLTASQTGMLDVELRGAKKALSDSVGGVEAEASYNAFRNSVRHALYGSALTDAEIKSFDAAYGKLGNKLGPVLAQFQASLSQVQSKLDSIAQLGNPYTSKVLLGADQKKMVQIRDALQARIDYIGGIQTNGGKKKTKELADIFGGK